MKTDCASGNIATWIDKLDFFTATRDGEKWLLIFIELLSRFFKNFFSDQFCYGWENIMHYMYKTLENKIKSNYGETSTSNYKYYIYKNKSWSKFDLIMKRKKVYEMHKLHNDIFSPRIFMHSRRTKSLI